jgi:hypothetical protein
MIVHRISAVSLVALKSENLSMVGTGSYYILVKTPRERKEKTTEVRIGNKTGTGIGVHTVYT